MSFVEELKRRNVLRIAAAYIAVSWLLIQVIETLFPIFGISDAAIRIVVIMLAAGFIPAVVIAWAFELTPEGLRRDSDVVADPAATARGNKRLDRLIAVALALAVAYFAVDKFVFDPARDREREQQVAETARAEGEAAARRQTSDGPPMVAVLPFVTTGSGEDSEFFAAGIHEDLLTQLAQVPSLRVISRTSVMEYKDVERNIREIGAALGADAILEGRVQSAGERIRINAQLIDADTDEHMWAETFDGELTPSSIFDLQTNIAQAITSAMQVTLNETFREAKLPTSNMAAYRMYHEALALAEEEHSNVYSEEYRNLLEEANRLDPGYTRPLAQLVGSLSLEAFRRPQSPAVARADEALARIEAVAPDSADHLIAQSYYTYYIIRDYEVAREIATRALELSPSDETLLQMRSWIERRLGDYDAMLETLRRAQRLNPRDPQNSIRLAVNLTTARRYDEAEAELEKVGNDYSWPLLLGAMLEARHHRDLSKVGSRFLEIADEFGEQVAPSSRLQGYILRRDFAAAAAFLEADPDPFAGMDDRRFGMLIQNIERVWTYRFSGESEKFAEALRIAQADFDDHFTSIEEHHIGEEELGNAFLAAMRGDRATAERLVRQWRREAATDLPARAAMWGQTCEILAAAGDGEVTADCLREGLSQPGRLMPFFDPFLPHYDGVREHPAFVELIAEIESQLQQPGTT